MTDIKRFDVTEHLRAKVRETLIGSLPDEHMDAMIQAEFRAYFEPELNRYNNNITNPSPFQSLVRETISKEVESSLRRWIDAYFAPIGSEIRINLGGARRNRAAGSRLGVCRQCTQGDHGEHDQACTIAAWLQRVGEQMKTPNWLYTVLLGIVIVGWATLIPLRFMNPDMTAGAFILTYWPLYTPLMLASAFYVWLRTR